MRPTFSPNCRRDTLRKSRVDVRVNLREIRLEENRRACFRRGRHRRIDDRSRVGDEERHREILARTCTTQRDERRVGEVFLHVFDMNKEKLSNLQRSRRQSIVTHSEQTTRTTRSKYPCLSLKRYWQFDSESKEEGKCLSTTGVPPCASLRSRASQTITRGSNPTMELR